MTRRAGACVVVISLGWGVQSWTMTAMSALGELPPVDAAIHSDTTWERSETYLFAAKWTKWLEDHDVRVVTVKPSRAFALEQKHVKAVIIPAFTLSASGYGQLRRQCTQRWKIAPMRRWLQANRNRKPVKMWLGISQDEVERARPSDVGYIENRFPLLEKRFTREECKRWLIAHDLEIPVKSSCVFCPYHNRAAWRDLRTNGNGDWQRAIMVDEAIRDARPPYDLFVHADRRPLSHIGAGIDAQPELNLYSEECAGACFL